MKHETIEARGCDAGPSILLGGGPVPDSKGAENLQLKAALNATKDSGVSLLRDHEFGRFVDHASVLIARRNGKAFVLVRCVQKERQHGGLVTVVRRRPWGWPDMDREFLNPASPAVERYANGVLDLIKRKARAVHEERERERIERLRSRGERV